MLDCQCGLALDREQTGSQRVAVKRDFRQVEHFSTGLDDRPVAGAAAKISGERAANFAFIRTALRRITRQIQAPQRHHEPRCAESALRTMAIHQRLLHRVQTPILATQVLDGE